MMDKQLRKQTIIEIGNLLDKDCRVCSIAGCDSCPVQERLLELGAVLSPRKEKSVEIGPNEPKEKMKDYVRVTPREYTKLFNKGMSNKDVAKLLNVSLRTVVKHRKLHKTAKGEKGKVINKRVARPHKDFVKCFEKGMSANDIALKFDCSENTVYTHKKKWVDDNILNTVKWSID